MVSNVRRLRLGEEKRKKKKKERTRNVGPMPNVVAVLLNIGGALCSTPQRLD